MTMKEEGVKAVSRPQSPQKVSHKLEAKDRWEKETLEPAIEQFPERKPVFETPSGIPLPAVLAAEDLDFDIEAELGYPGEYPFTRGVQPNMHRGRLWTMRQYAGYASAEESNRRYRYLLAQGQSGLSVAFDLPTQIGYDSDHPLARGEGGRGGVAIDSVEAMADLLSFILSKP